MIAAIGPRTVLPPTEDEPALASLATALEGASAVLVEPDGTEAPLPDEVRQVLKSLVDAMTQGLAITVAPHSIQLTTQEAADFLGVPRPTLVRLLEDGDIPFELRGRHRRVILADIIAYQ